MRVYEPTVRPGFEWVLPVRDTDNETLWSLDGTPRQATWQPVPVTRLTTADDGTQRAEADLPWLGSHVLVLRARAAEALAPLLEPHGELLPLACPDANLWLYNATTVIDALDETRSKLIRFDDGTILAIEHYEFRPERLTPVFKVPQLLRGPLFVTEELAEAITTAGLTGLDLTELWKGPTPAGP